MSKKRASEGNEDVVSLKQKQQKVWSVVPSDFAQLCVNPIRKIVDNIQKPTDSDKALIPLSLGDPTVFGNLKCPGTCIYWVDLLVYVLIFSLQTCLWKLLCEICGTCRFTKELNSTQFG